MQTPAYDGYNIHVEAKDILRLLLTFCTNIHEAAVQCVTISIFRVVHQRQNAGTGNGQKANYFISFATTKSKFLIEKLSNLWCIKHNEAIHDSI